jgi:hypothetical protein
LVPYFDYIVHAVALSLIGILKVFPKPTFDFGLPLSLGEGYHFMDVLKELMVIDSVIFNNGIDGSGLGGKNPLAVP